MDSKVGPAGIKRPLYCAFSDASGQLQSPLSAYQRHRKQPSYRPFSSHTKGLAITFVIQTALYMADCYRPVLIINSIPPERVPTRKHLMLLSSSLREHGHTFAYLIVDRGDYFPLRAHNLLRITHQIREEWEVVTSVNNQTRESMPMFSQGRAQQQFLIERV